MDTQKNSGNGTYELYDLIPSDGEKVRRSEQVNRVVTHLLDNRRVYEADKALSTSNIIDAYHALRDKNPDIYDIPENSLSAYMSYLARNSVSRIQCAGTTKGYYLSRVRSVAGTANPVKDEKLLYPFLERWLSMQCDAVKDISAKHKKKGIWTNPDIMGLNIFNILGSEAVDITTIEAKLSMDKWRMDIFEAVSHARFANRSYYAFLCDYNYKVTSEIFLFAQEYGIGLIEIRLPEDWQSGMDIDMECISEILPAPRRVISPQVQEEVLKKYNVREVSDIYENWKTSKDFE